MDSSIFEVYALRYAMHEGRKASENFLFHEDQHSSPMPLSFYLWAIKGLGRTVVVDTGFDESMARKRGRTFLHSPKDLLSDIGIKAEDVTDVIITHMHYDHCGNLGLFPKAKYHIQEAEMAYCTGRSMTYSLLRRPFESKNIKDAIDCLFQDRLIVHDGDVDLGDGIRLHKVGGHTKGMQIVSIPTQRGNIVLASDAAHFWENINLRSPFPIVVDVQRMFAAYDVMECLADGPFHVIPGHDPKVLEIFPRLPNNADIAILHAEPVENHGLSPIAKGENQEAATVSRIAIVGMGPRGISVLEKLIKYIDEVSLDGQEVEIMMIDPGPCGEGAHSSDQHEDLLINTVASQISIFGLDSLVNGAHGPSLTEWARQAGYRRIGNRYRISNSGEGDAISDADYLPRRLLGQYLGWAFEQMTCSLPERIQIRHIRRRVLDLRKIDDETFLLELDEGPQLLANYIVLATGHGTRSPTETDLKYQSFASTAENINPSAAYYRSPYPTENLATIHERACVAIQGLGLTAYDVISSLTSARGGWFRETKERLEYIPSGNEPRILLVSRNCLPFAARGINQKGLTGSHQAAFFTLKSLDSLRHTAIVARGSPRLNFEHEVLPLIKLEMAYAYRLALQDGKVDPAEFVPSDEECEAIDRLLDPLAYEKFSSLEHFRDYFRRQVEEDLRHACLGNLTSPVKAAADVLRDTREALRAAVEFGGLTPSSHRVFVESFVPTANRISFGPPKQRNAELLALMDSGVLSVAGGPGNEIELDRERGQFCIVSRLGKEPARDYADVLISARLDVYSPLTDSSPLSNNLLASGIARPYLNGDYHPGGLDISQDLKVIDSKGCVHDRLWAIGIPIEGPHFYTHALPRSSKASRFSLDAEQCALQIVEVLSRRHASPSVMNQMEEEHKQKHQLQPARTEEVTKKIA
ncbi:FAD/NAD(P)-binding protein [Halomonas sp. MCCC 1A11062]|uniref:FAD/NAD(P)-binding protein n=1 Tax=Halomonas sp. MCCC 1A11062 TaxID=2733485 RepID=UPI001F302D92|nr:FAD/NAD(P)-binding protein [Halomonas sp. MCCC 1A11062]